MESLFLEESVQKELRGMFTCGTCYKGKIKTKTSAVALTIAKSSKLQKNKLSRREWTKQTVATVVIRFLHD